jgi:hypothetical protein
LLARASEHKWSVRVLVDRVRNQGGLAANSTTKGGHSQGKRALAFYRGGMKCIREGLHLLLTTNAVEPAEAKDLSATLRELGLLMQQTADALRVVSRTIAPEPMPKILSSASAA